MRGVRRGGRAVGAGIGERGGKDSSVAVVGGGERARGARERGGDRYRLGARRRWAVDDVGGERDGE